LPPFLSHVYPPGRIAACLLVLMFFFAPAQAISGEKSALEQMIEIFENKKLLDPAEAARLKKIVEQERAVIQEKEDELKRKESSLAEKEKLLNDREKALREQEAVAAQEEKRVPEVAAREAKKEEPSSEKGFPIKVTYKDRLRFSDPEGDKFSLYLGGLLQTDYRYYNYENGDPQENKFDLRRVRLLMGGSVFNRVDYKFEYEFQGVSSRRVLDAYVDVRALPYLAVRAGQGKEPFSLEQYTKDMNIFFAERSMGYYLSPHRDIGVMAHASIWDDAFNYGVGVFNGDGVDDTSGGDVDDPEFTGRAVFSPFKHTNLSWLQGLQIGGSGSYANIDRNNVNVDVKTTGLTTFFEVATSAKFNVILDAGSRVRYGAELGWSYGPLALMAEYIVEKFDDIRTSSNEFGFDLDDYYVSLLWMITGEHPYFEHSVFQPIEPKKSVWKGGFGAVGLALRYDNFTADKSVYENLINMGESVREAKAYTVALNWWLDRYSRIIIDFTRTEFDEPLLIARDSLTGETIFSDYENVLTARFQFAY